MSMQDAVQPTARRSRGVGFRLFGEHRWVPWLFVLFFIAIFAVLGNFVRLAVGTFTGLVTTNAYERGLAYDDLLEAERLQAERGWTMDLALPELSGPNQTAAVTLHDRNGEPLSGGAVVMMAERMTRYAQQVRLNLHDAGNGVYEAEANFPISGRWMVSILADIDGQRHFETTEIFLITQGVE
ncbi:MAG: FixH family protein [Pseudomonadota bacterium]